MTKLTNVNSADSPVSEFFDKGFLDNTEEMAKVKSRNSANDNSNIDLGKRLHLGEAQETNQNQDYTTPSSSFSRFKSKFRGPEFLESKEHREAMKDVYESQFKDQAESSDAASRDWIHQKLSSNDLDECDSASSVKTLPTRTSHRRDSGLSKRRKSIPHRLEPLHLQESRKSSARRRGSLPLFISNSPSHGPTSDGTKKFLSLPRITESALVGRESSTPSTEISESDTAIANGRNSSSGVYRNISGYKLKQPATGRRRSMTFDISFKKEYEREIEKRRPKQKWRILFHKRKCLFKDEIDFEPKLNREKLPSSSLPKLTR